MTKELSLFHNIFFPAATLSGTVIGAGMFSLPFAFVSAGWAGGIFYFVLFTGVFSLVHLMYADIIMRSGGEPKFAGFAARYLGAWSFYPALLIVTVGMLLVLTAFLALSSSFGSLLLGGEYGMALPVFFWLLGSLGMCLNVRRLASAEFWMTFVMVLIAAGIGVYGAAYGSHGNISLWPRDVAGLLLPFGPMLFALSGRPAVPSVVEYVRAKKISVRNLKWIIAVGTLLPACVYLLFVFGVARL